MHSPFWGRSCSIGWHMCLLLKLNISAFMPIWFEILNKGFPYFRINLFHWPTHLSLSWNQFFWLYDHLRCEFDKVLPCLRKYRTHWPTHLSLSKNKPFLFYAQILWNFLQGTPLFEVLASPLVNIFASFSNLIVILDKKIHTFVPWINFLSIRLPILPLYWYNTGSKTSRYLWKLTPTKINTMISTTSYPQHLGRGYSTVNPYWLQ